MTFRKQPGVAFWATVVVLLLLYCAAYSADVTTGGVVVMANPEASRRDGSLDPKLIWQGAEYRFGDRFAALLFLPIHSLDRMLRPDVWGYYEP